MTGAIKLIYAIIWFALAVGVGESLVEMTKAMRVAAIKAHQRGPISYKLFTEQLTGQK
ncbi:MAG: hypothetical protein IPM57_02500 [Oligoflexia bacterium]|nr:hypothetical protein [Oligoflexia bacterium]